MNTPSPTPPPAILPTAVTPTPEPMDALVEKSQQHTEKESRLLIRAKELVVDSAESDALCAELIVGIADFRKTIVADFATAKKASYDAWKAICAQESGHLDKLDEPDDILRRKHSAYLTAQKVIKDKAEADARAVALKAAEDKKLVEAQQAERENKPLVAEAILRSPIIPAAIVRPQTAAPKVAGLATVTVWSFTVIDENLIPREYFTRNDSAIQKVVNALKDKCSIPGITVSSELTTKTTGRK